MYIYVNINRELSIGESSDECRLKIVPRMRFKKCIYYVFSDDVNLMTIAQHLEGQ